MKSLISTARRMFHTVRRINTQQGFTGVIKATLVEMVPNLARVLVYKPEVPKLSNIAPSAIPLFNSPQVTILLPVYNNLNLTIQCLNSIISVKNKTPYKVIVLNDCSTDDTAEVLKNVANLELINQPENLGFLRNVNVGFENLSTKYVLLLNNDTVVLDSWLDELVATFDIYNNVGLVGSQLLYPNGRLQESGGLIWSDASGYNYGRGLNPNHPNFGYLRETDYCSGACILLKSRIIQDLGGFDTQFSPAYYEDTDLAFQIQDMGLKVMVNPISQVIHLEGMTCGKDTSSGVKQYQIKNQTKFKVKWQTRLNSQMQPISRPDLELYRSNGRDILVLDARIPEPNKDSGSVRMFQILKILTKLGYKTTFMPDNLNGSGAGADNLRRLGIKLPCRPFFSVKSFLKKYGRTYQSVLISHTEVAARNLNLVKKYMPEAKIIFDTVDLGHVRVMREANHFQSSRLYKRALHLKQRELSQIKSSDCCLVVSYDEKEYLEKMSLGTPVIVVSNIHDTYHADTTFEERHDIIFIGGYDHPPNRDAVDFLVEEIMPRVLDMNPNITLKLIGSNMPSSVKALSAENVKVLGYVEDLTTILRTAKLSVAPLRYGAGVKGKVNQSMSYGLPVVATNIAAEGMKLIHEHDVLIADTAAQFAEEICRLYHSPIIWQRIADNSRLNVKNNFSESAAINSLAPILQQFHSK